MTIRNETQNTRIAFYTPDWPAWLRAASNPQGTADSRTPGATCLEQLRHCSAPQKLSDRRVVSALGWAEHGVLSSSERSAVLHDAWWLGAEGSRDSGSWGRQRQSCWKGWDGWKDNWREEPTDRAARAERPGSAAGGAWPVSVGSVEEADDKTTAEVGSCTAGECRGPEDMWASWSPWGLHSTPLSEMWQLGACAPRCAR